MWYRFGYVQAWRRSWVCLRRRDCIERIEGNATTSIHDLLELCELFSLATFSPKVDSVLEKYLKGRQVANIFPAYHENWGDCLSNVCAYLRRGFSYGDALMAEAVEQSEAEVFVTGKRNTLKAKSGSRR